MYVFYATHRTYMKLSAVGQEIFVIIKLLRFSWSGSICENKFTKFNFTLYKCHTIRENLIHEIFMTSNHENFQPQSYGNLQTLRLAIYTVPANH